MEGCSLQLFHIAKEVVALKVCDIDSKRMMLRVEQGKGRKDRHAMLEAVA
jgi:integrase/recombinase XerD